jgi:hypothetical protein
VRVRVTCDLGTWARAWRGVVTIIRGVAATMATRGPCEGWHGAGSAGWPRRGMVMGTRSPLAASLADACWTRAWRGVQVVGKRSCRRPASAATPSPHSGRYVSIHKFFLTVRVRAPLVSPIELCGGVRRSRPAARPPSRVSGRCQKGLASDEKRTDQS